MPLVVQDKVEVSLELNRLDILTWFKGLCFILTTCFQVFSEQGFPTWGACRARLVDTRPKANPLVRPACPLLRGKNRKALMNLR